MRIRLLFPLLIAGIAACGAGTAPERPESPPPPENTGKTVSRYDDSTRRLLAMPADSPDQFLVNARTLGMAVQGDSVIFELQLEQDSSAAAVREELEKHGIAVRRIMDKYRRTTVYVSNMSELEALGTARHIRRVTATPSRYSR